MELYYVLIDHFRDFAKTEFNFGAEFAFKYNHSESELIIKQNANFIPGFFNLKNDSKADSNYAIIENVSALIGQNGAGKTSFIDFINNTLPRGLNGVRENLIIAFKNGKNKKFIYHTPDIIIKKSNYHDFGFQLKTCGKKKIHVKSDDLGEFPMHEYESIPEFGEIDIVNFSNIFDERTEFYVEGLINLTTNFLIKNDIKFERQQLHSSMFQSEVETYRYYETQRQIDFIHNFSEYSKIIPFTLPERMVISVKDTFNIEPLNVFRKELLDRKEEYSSHLEQVLKESNNEIKQTASISKRCHIMFSTRAYLVFFLEHADLDSMFMINNEILSVESEKENGIVNTLLTNIDKIIAYYQHHTKRININLDILIKNAQGTKNFINFLIDEIQDQNAANDQGNSIFFDIAPQFANISNFLRYYNESFGVLPYLNFYWRDLSSGEKAFLKILSRLYSLSDKILINPLKKDVLILFDEAEIYLHPNWQKQFIKLLLDVTPIMLTSKDKKNVRSVHFIFASNSPFIITDIPSSNITFLKKESLKGTIVIESLEERKQTFASNIHTLLSDSFFLHNGAIGDFAKAKINAIIEMLSGKFEIIEGYKEEIEATINLIGEPIIKTKLLQMLNDRLLANGLSVHKRLKKLEDDVLKMMKKEN
jgi:hypothetical protein